MSAGHRVAGHENKCRDFHGHNYRVHFHCMAERLDDLGRVVDFGIMKERLCMWLEYNWDHKFLMWEKDELLPAMMGAPGIIAVPFNPTAENMAAHLVDVVGPKQLNGTGVKLIACRIDETRKCSATYTIDPFGGDA
jgi:6-pyruvoyltetrahydropterin/6-carboxytetrahydropterin synthase